MEKTDDRLLCNDVEVPFVKHEDVITRCMLPMFRKDGERLYYSGKLCRPRKSVSDVLQLAHDSKISGRFKFAKTLSRLNNFHWRHKSRDVRKYVEGIMKYQQF